jgi:glucose-6-phosphate isomerase
MLIQNNINNLLKFHIEIYGKKEPLACMDNTMHAVTTIREAYNRNEMRFMHYANPRNDLSNLRNISDKIRENFDEVIVLGTGGSSLGAQALIAINGQNFSNNNHYSSPILHFPDNLGPFTMTSLVEGVELSRTHFLVVSKSGETAETLAQLMSCMAAIRNKLGSQEIGQHFTVIVQPGDNILRRFARRWNLPILDHDPALGGRFSVLSLVGLLPAMIVGLDITSILKGAEIILNQFLEAQTPEDIPAAVGASLIHFFAKTERRQINIMMPYECRLEMFARWHQQLWAESVGKNNQGTTPVRALGPVDQHSQLQLYLDGPDDKFFTIITNNMNGEGPTIDPFLASDPELGYMAGRTLGDLVAAESRATIETLIRHKKPLRHIQLESLNEACLGALLMHFMLETVIGAELFGVNAFNQPAVEEGKLLTRQYLEKGRSISTTK